MRKPSVGTRYGENVRDFATMVGIRKPGAQGWFVVMTTTALFAAGLMLLLFVPVVIGVVRTNPDGVVLVPPPSYAEIIGYPVGLFVFGFLSAKLVEQLEP